MQIQSVEELAPQWVEYMRARRGTYEFRSATRYRAVAEIMLNAGLRNGQLVVDVGAGTCQFDRYLRRELNWCGRYLPVDAVIDGTDLNHWRPRVQADWFVCIEVLEHLHSPFIKLVQLREAARCGVVITTPNHECVDVLGCDPTHVSVVTANQLEMLDFVVERRSFFGTPEDTLLAYKLN